MICRYTKKKREDKNKTSEKYVKRVCPIVIVPNAAYSGVWQLQAEVAGVNILTMTR